MKTSSFLPRTAFLAVAMGIVGVTTSFAQSTTNTDSGTPPSGKCHHHFGGSLLTADEKAQLKKDREAALAANPDLQTQLDNLKQQKQDLGSDATADQKKALFQQWKDFETQLQAAEVQIDPTVAPILAKLKAAHHGWHHHHNSDQSDSSSDQSSS